MNSALPDLSDSSCKHSSMGPGRLPTAGNMKASWIPVKYHIFMDLRTPTHSILSTRSFLRDIAPAQELNLRKLPKRQITELKACRAFGFFPKAWRSWTTSASDISFFLHNLWQPPRRVSGRQLKVRTAAGTSYANFSFGVADFFERPSAPASVQRCS